MYVSPTTTDIQAAWHTVVQGNRRETKPRSEERESERKKDLCNTPPPMDLHMGERGAPDAVAQDGVRDMECGKQSVNSSNSNSQRSIREAGASGSAHSSLTWSVRERTGAAAEAAAGQ